MKKLVSDGVLVSTPAGSTAYNLSVHGPILSLNSKKISIAPISAFRPRRWAGKIVSDKSKIIIKNTTRLKRKFSSFREDIERDIGAQEIKQDIINEFKLEELEKNESEKS